MAKHFYIKWQKVFPFTSGYFSHFNFAIIEKITTVAWNQEYFFRIYFIPLWTASFKTEELEGSSTIAQRNGLSLQKRCAPVARATSKFFLSFFFLRWNHSNEQQILTKTFHSSHMLHEKNKKSLKTNSATYILKETTPAKIQHIKLKQSPWWK